MELVIGIILIGAILIIGYLSFRGTRWFENKELFPAASGLSVIREMLADHPYYKNLSPAGKNRFAERTRQIISVKHFKGMNGLKITTEMKVKIAACLAQLTFGLEKFELHHFTEIRVFPKPFYSSLNRRYLKGGATPHGMLMLSWSDFVDGYDDATDRYNLGLHEAAHALRLDVIHGSRFEKELGARMERWEQDMRHEFEMMQENRTGFLRDYAATNEEEFFAVCVEHFFEVPEAFRQRLPDLYHSLCILLRQDPTEKDHDYRPGILLQSLIDAEPKRKNSRYDTWHWSLTVLLLGIFVMPFVVLFLIARTNADADQLWMYFALSVFASLIFFRKLVSRQQNILGRVQFYSFAILGMGPLIFSVLLTLNLLIPIHTDSVEEYVIVGVVPKTNIVLLTDNAYSDRELYRNIGYNVPASPSPGDTLRIHFRRGVLGLGAYRFSEIIYQAADLKK